MTEGEVRGLGFGGEGGRGDRDTDIHLREVGEEGYLV